MNPKYQIFISSTYEDLVTERTKVRDAILSIMQFPVGMELFGAADEESWEIIRETIDSSDYYVLIIANRYGSVTDDGISYTEKEYRYAEGQGIPVLAFIISETVEPLAKNVDNENQEKLKAFKSLVCASHQVDVWLNADDLKSKVLAALHKQMSRKKRPGWVRGDSYFEKSTEEVLKLNEENRQLRSELEEARKALRNVQNRRPRIRVDIDVYDIKNDSGDDNEYDSVDELKEDVANSDTVVIDTLAEEGKDVSGETEDSDRHSETRNIAGHIKIPFRRIPRKTSLGDLKPLKLDDVPREIKSMVTKEQLDEYNAKLPKKSVIETYEKKVFKYKLYKFNSTGLALTVFNEGTLVAKNVLIRMHLPDGLMAVEKRQIQSAAMPAMPRRPRNPIDKAYAEYEKRRHLGLYDDPLRDVVSLMSASVAGLPFAGLSPVGIDSRIPPVEALVDWGYALIVDGEEITIRIDEFQHKGCRFFDECALIPQKPGKYEVGYSVICDEYPEEERGTFVIEVFDDGWYNGAVD